LFAFARVSQGSSFLATLGFEPGSLWDSRLEFPKGIKPCVVDTICSGRDAATPPTRSGQIVMAPVSLNVFVPSPNTAQSLRLDDFDLKSKMHHSPTLHRMVETG